MKIKNATAKAISLPGHIIEAGQTAHVPEWLALRGSPVVAAWVKARILIVCDQPEPVEAPVEAVADEKDELIAQLLDLGIHRDRRSSLESLKAALADAEAE